MKKSNQYKLLILIAIILFSIDVYSVQIDASKRTSKLIYDSSRVDLRLPDSLSIQKYAKDKDFIYFDDPKATMTLWEKFIAWIKSQSQLLFQTDTYNTTIDIIIYLLIGLAVIVILYGIFKPDIRNIFFTNDRKSIKYSEEIEDINVIDFDKLIEDAVEKGNYRFAVRLNYLKVLKLLADRGIISWRIEKTNREFVREIKLKQIKSAFENITSNFELIWYGGLTIEADSYNEIKESFTSFNSFLEVNTK